MFTIRTQFSVVLFSLSLTLTTMATAANPEVASNPACGSTVEVIRTGNNWSLQVNGQPFTVHGAGMGYTDAAGVRSLSDAGGNAFRTWGTQDLDSQLAAAMRFGLKVLVGLDMSKELQGFDYDDTNAVAQQQAQIERIIEKYKCHPSLLGWLISNEPNLMIGADGAVVQPNPKVYEAINDVLEYIHLHDPNHPATVALGFTPTLSDDVKLMLAAMPSIDFLSFQAYGALPIISSFVSEQNIELPYMVTEFGPLGHWEMPSTQWGREIEEPSGHKAAGMVKRIQQAGLDKPRGQLLGSFAFLWGHKQERTPTWYGLFTEDGSRTAAVDELTKIWTGKYPTARAPSAWSMLLDDKSATANIVLAPNQRAKVQLQVDDPNGDNLNLKWQMMTEVGDRSHGGESEAPPKLIDVTFSAKPSIGDQHSVEFNAPAQPDQYRLYVWAYDNNGGVATANIPFLIKAP